MRQQIKENEVDNKIYHCINRNDEHPFDLKNRNIVKNEIKSTQNSKWLKYISEPCPEGKYFRRCLGHRSDKCIYAQCNCIFKSFTVPCRKTLLFLYFPLQICHFQNTKDC